VNRDRVQSIIDDLSEGLEVEVKNWLEGLADNNHKSKLAKEIIALANYGGGYIFIGFDDEGNHPEIRPAEAEENGFTQDSIASVVSKYLEPQIQCELGYFCVSDSDVQHPVIVVPGGHRTPIWAKSGSPDGKTLKVGEIYLRRPGAKSEPPKTQDDWEYLLDRLLRNRQDELVGALRSVLNPPSTSLVGQGGSLDSWSQKMYGEWASQLSDYSEDSPMRLKRGHWWFSFEIEGFKSESLSDLNKFLANNMPRYSGWPVFIVLDMPGRNPEPKQDRIECSAIDSQDPNEHFSDFWSVNLQGQGFALRHFQEDESSFLANRTPRPEGGMFAYTIHIYRAGEYLKAVEALANKYSLSKSRISVTLNYVGMRGRELVVSEMRYMFLSRGGRSNSNEIKTSIDTSAEKIKRNLHEEVHRLLSPVYEQFGFTELSKATVDQVIDDMLSF